MAIKVQSSFSTGELDPALHERTTLAKYKSGLKTGRNVIVTKTGSLRDRHSRRFGIKTRYASKKVVGYSPPGTGYFLEWGDLYVRIFSISAKGAFTQLFQVAHLWVEADIPKIHFDTSGDNVYVYCEGKNPYKLNYVTGTFSADPFAYPAPPAFSGVTVNTSAGYLVDYAVTLVRNGQESLPLEIAAGATNKLPIAAGQSNYVDAIVNPTGIDTTITEARYYRRPAGGGAYGFIGSTTAFFTSGSNYISRFTDIGATADYTHTPPAIITADARPIGLLYPKTGLVYQQRLLIANIYNDKEGILASRPAYQNNFYRDFPLNAASSLRFKSGTSGRANVLRMIDSDGLVVFTTAGVFLNSGALGPDNIALTRKGKWVIKEDVPPLAVPGGVFFVDKSTNVIRDLVWSTEMAGYNGVEVSIYSNHLFQKRSITAWGFMDGNHPILWVSFSDGQFATLTYESDQEMRAWTRHDSQQKVEQVIATETADQAVFLMVNSDASVRHWEITIPLETSVDDLLTDPESIMGQSMIGLMDCAYSWSNLINKSLVDDNLTLTAVNGADEHDGAIHGDMQLACVDDAIFPSPGIGAVGTVFRWFNPLDQTSIDLTIVSRTGNNQVRVTPNSPWPTSYVRNGITVNNKTNPRLYEARNSFTTIPDVLNGVSVSVLGDGGVIASPNNDDQNYDPVVVTGGAITLAEKVAILHVGRPFTCDFETLDIDTVEQAPTLIESISVNKLYVKVHQTRGLYIGNRFPANDKIAGMQDIEQYTLDYEDPDPILGNTYRHPETRRHEITLNGDWTSQGRICGRQVDPLHFEVLSLIPDMEVETRSDRGDI